jgi:hypothetical protein
MVDRIAHGIVRLSYNGNNLLLGDPHKPEQLDTRNWLNRLIFLESIAGIPGMAGGMHRHLKSLRSLERDNGWIHHLLQEAENERMHLFFLLRLRNPGIFLRSLIQAVQFVMMPTYFLMYAAFPRACHRWVGYLEETAVESYSLLIKHVKEGHFPEFATEKAP